MRDLKRPGMIWLKAGLLLTLALLSSLLLLLEAPRLTVALWLAVTVWAWCRCYYFAFHALQRYVDPGYRFSGLLSLLAYVLKARRPPA